MSKASSNDELSPVSLAPTSCPVAALADEAQRYIDAHNFLDELRLRAEKDDDDASAQMAVINKFLYAALDRATFSKAASARGALFQICIVRDYVDSLETMTTNVPVQLQKASQLADAVYRMLASIADFIESVSEAKREDACGAFFMNRCLTDHALVEAALAKTRKKAEART